MRFWESYELFLADNKARTSEGNYDNNESIGRNWLKPSLEHRKLGSITEQDWQNCVNAAIQKGRAKKTLKNIRGAISAFNRFAKKNGVIMALSCEIDIPKTSPVKKKAILQPDKLRILFSRETTIEGGKEVRSFFIHAFRFCVLTGLRRGELLGLKRTDIESGTVQIQRSINKYNHVGPTKTPKANRTFRVNKHMQRELEAQAAMLKSRRIISPWVFPDETGDHAIPATFYDRWQVYCKYHGFRVTLHDLRRTLISIGRTGLTKQQVKDMVGHEENMDTFGVYGEMIDGEQQEVADALDRLFAKYLKEDQKDS
jgi:integrase